MLSILGAFGYAKSSCHSIDIILCNQALGVKNIFLKIFYAIIKI